MPNHKHNNANIVLNGTAPELCFPHIKKFKKKQVVNTIPGKSVAVYNKLCDNIKNFYFLNFIPVILICSIFTNNAVLLHFRPRIVL